MRSAARCTATVVLLGLLATSFPAFGAERILWKDNDDLAAPEPGEDDEGESLWWHDARSLSFYQTEKGLDLGKLFRSVGRAAHLVGPREAANVNPLDEVPDSTWFTNRHALRPLAEDELRRGPVGARPPSDGGALTIVSGKGLGEVPGFVVRDEKGDRYLVKFDPIDHPELATGAEQVSSRIVHALGWNVPDYHVAILDPKRLVIGEGASLADAYGRKRPMLRTDVEDVLAAVAQRPDGTVRASMSRMIPGAPKGPFRFEGLRPDDPNDTVPHEHRRELRGFRPVAAWIQHTDFRPVNTLDVFVKEPRHPRGFGHLVHYLLDFSSTLGSADLEWKHPKLGHEYVIDPPVIVANFFSLGLWVKAWEDVEVSHPTLGYFEASTIDPEDWVTEYPNALFDNATVRDHFWGAKHVASIRDDELRVLVSTGEWSDPRVADLLFRILRERRDHVARVWFDFQRINPTSDFRIEDGRLRCDDLGVGAGLVESVRARYRHRASGGDWIESGACLVPAVPATIELETSHDAGRSWSPTTEVTLSRNGAGLAIVEIFRHTE